LIAIDEPHPRKPEFVTSAKFTSLRNQLYGLLHDENPQGRAAIGSRRHRAAETGPA